MSAFYLMIPISLLLALVFLLAFVHSVSRGQFDDITSSSQRMLEDGLRGDGSNQHPHKIGIINSKANPK